MNLSTVRSKLAKLEERASTGDQKPLIPFPMSDLERANRIRYLLEERPNEEAAKRLGELIRIARQRMMGESS